MNSDVIVVGAGISGLCAAKCLKEAGVSVIVLEARDRVGGRTLTKKDPKVNYVDLGGAYVGPTQDRILRVIKELGVETYKISEEGDSLFYKNGKTIRHKPNQPPTIWNPFAIMDLNNVIWLIEKMGKEIPHDCPWNAPHADEWDTLTCRDFFLKTCWTQSAIDFCSTIMRVLYTSEIYEPSLLSLLWLTNQCGGLRRMTSISNGGQERKLKGGVQQLSEKLTEKLGGDSVVIKSSPVVGINQEAQDFVLVKTLDGKEYKTKYVILACSPIMQMKIHFSPQLPPLRNQLMQRTPMGTINKIHLYYKSAFWKEKGLNGSFMIDGGDEHPVLFTLDDTKPDGTFPAIIGFIAADKCRNLSDLAPDDRKDMIARSFEKVTGCPEAVEPIHYEEKNWMEEQYSGGCYTTMYPPGFLTRYGKHLRTPVDRLHFAATETAVKWAGALDGAVESGERSAREILHKMGKISRDEIWQEEPQSADVIPRPFVVSFGERFLPSVSTFLKMLALSTLIGAAAIVYSQWDELWKK